MKKFYFFVKIFNEIIIIIIKNILINFKNTIIKLYINIFKIIKFENDELINKEVLLKK